MNDEKGKSRGRTWSRLLLAWLSGFLASEAYSGAIFLAGRTPNWLDITLVTALLWTLSRLLTSVARRIRQCRITLWLSAAVLVVALINAMLYGLWVRIPDTWLGVSESWRPCFVPERFDWRGVLLSPFGTIWTLNYWFLGLRAGLVSGLTITLAREWLLFFTVLSTLATVLALSWEVFRLALSEWAGTRWVIQHLRPVLHVGRTFTRRIWLARWSGLVLKTLAILAVLTILASLAGVVSTARPPTLEWEVSRPHFEPPGGPRSVDDLAVAPDGTAYAVSGGRVFRRGTDDEAWQLSSTGITHRVTTVFADPHGGQLYAGTDGGGVFRLADDDGQTWQPVNEGLTALDVLALAVGEGGLLYAGTDGGGVFRSDDGQTWQPVGEGLTELDVQALAVAEGGVLYTGTGDGVFRLVDGEHWKVINEGLVSLSIQALAVDERGVLYAGAGTQYRTEPSGEMQRLDGGVFRLADGETWQPVNEGLTALYVNALAVGEGGVLYAGTSGGVFRSADGETWQPVNEGLTALYVSTLAVGKGGVLYVRTSGGVFRSADGETWQPVNEGLTSLYVNTLALGEGGVLYAGTYGGGVFRSDDGQTWQPVNEGLTDLDVNALAVAEGGVLYAGTWGGGVFRSADGETWQAMNEGLTALYVRALAVGEGGMLYAGTSGGVFRSADGETWQAVNEGLLSLSVRALVVDGGSVLYAGARTQQRRGLSGEMQTFDGGVFRSADGETWQPVNEGLTELDVNALAVGGGDVLYAGTSGGVFRSTDGETWQAVSEGLTSLYVNSLAVDEEGLLYVGTGGGGVCRLADDDGQTWQPVNEGLTDLDVNALTVSEGGALYAGTDVGGVFRSADGQTWQPVNEGLTDLYMSALAVGEGDVLYAGTWNGGAFRSADGQTWQPVNERLTSLYVRTLAVGEGGLLYAGTGGGVFRLADGETWEAVNEGPTSLDVRALAVGEGGLLYAGTFGDGVFRSADGETWQAVNAGLTDLDVKALAVGQGGVLYARGWHSEQDTEGETISVPEVYALGADDVWRPWSPLGWTLGELPDDLGNTAGNTLLWARSGRQLWLSQDGRTWLPLVKLPPNIPQAIEMQDDQILFQTFVGAGMLLHSTMGLPLVWHLPAPYLALVAAGWEVVDWVGANPLPSTLIVLLPTLLLVRITFNTMRASHTSFPMALRLVLSGQFGDVSLDTRWPAWERDLRETLRHRGTVDNRTPLAIPAPLRRQVFERYFDLHGEREELAVRGDGLRLTAAARTQAWLVAWEPPVTTLAETGTLPASTQFAPLVDPLGQTLGLRQIGRRSLGRLHAMIVSAPALRLKIPPRFPLVFVEPSAIRPGIEDDLVDLSQVLDLGEFFALIIPFEAPEGVEANAQQLKTLLRASPYAHDLIVLSHEDILALLSAREPAARLVECILEQVDLTVVSPFVTSGPVPHRMFFGRDQEIKTITQALPRTDFALVGNRKIGKTSLLQRIERILEGSETCIPIPLNFQAVRDDGTLFETLAQEVGFAAASRDPHAFSDFIAHLRQQHPDRMPILLIDEVDDLLAFDAGRGYGLSAVWRTLAFDGSCRFVFVGSRVLARALRDAASPFFNFPQETRLGFLTPDKARAVVSGPMGDLGIELEPRQPLLDRILDLSSCHPNLVQFLCAQLIERISGRGERRILLADLDEVATGDKFADYYLDTLWGQTEPLERAITILGDPAGFTMPDVEAALAGHGFDTPRRAVKEALDMLAVYSVLERKGRTYTFAPASFPRILRETQEVDYLLEEARRGWVEAIKKPGF